VGRLLPGDYCDIKMDALLWQPTESFDSSILKGIVHPKQKGKTVICQTGIGWKLISDSQDNRFLCNSSQIFFVLLDDIQTLHIKCYISCNQTCYVKFEDMLMRLESYSG